MTFCFHLAHRLRVVGASLLYDHCNAVTYLTVEERQQSSIQPYVAKTLVGRKFYAASVQGHQVHVLILRNNCLPLSRSLNQTKSVIQ